MANKESNGGIPRKSPIEKLKDQVDQNPLDFNAWVQLLAMVEVHPSLSKETVEATFDRFLNEFPLCFGYWNKYALYELNLGRSATSDTPPQVTPATATKRAREIYERGIAAVRHSVQMWQKYCEFLIDTIRVPVDEARIILEKAITACGNDPLAGPLWDMYIQLETNHNEMIRLNQVFKRILQHPLSNLEEFWEKYNQFVLAQQLHVLATADDLKAMGASEEMDEGLLRIKIVNRMEAIKNKTMEGIVKRQHFEAAIDRSYFHVTPVTDKALKNWHAYLDYEEITGDDTRCELLYERCMISCANYEQLWVRFALWKERTSGFEAANLVFRRAVEVFLKYRASMYLEYAVFLEANGKMEDAREMYTTILRDVAPQLVEAMIKYAHFERRQGHTEVTKLLYERGFQILLEGGQPDSFVVLAVSYATYVFRTLGDRELAREIYQRSTDQITGSLSLWIHYIQFEIAQSGADLVQRVSSIFTTALAEISEMSNDEKNDLWIQYSEFIEEYASNIADMRAVIKKEMTWRRKNKMPRVRMLRVLRVESSLDVPSAFEDPNVVGNKRPRYDSPVITPAEAPVAVPAPVQASQNAAYAQYYQGYGAQGTSSPATTTGQASAAATAAYYQQYAAYYQQHQ